MNPDKIKAVIAKHFVGIKSEPIQDGWSFFFEEVRRGTNSTRIVRAKQSQGRIFFKLAASARLKKRSNHRIDYDTEIKDPAEKQVLELFERELRLWKEHLRVR